jgi:hypothetical protein
MDLMGTQDLVEEAGDHLICLVWLWCWSLVGHFKSEIAASSRYTSQVQQYRTEEESLICQCFGMKPQGGARTRAGQYEWAFKSYLEATQCEEDPGVNSESVNVFEDHWIYIHCTNVGMHQIF